MTLGLERMAFEQIKSISTPENTGIQTFLPDRDWLFSQPRTNPSIKAGPAKFAGSWQRNSRYTIYEHTVPLP